jgi:hypothetical protein
MAAVLGLAMARPASQADQKAAYQTGPVHARRVKNFLVQKNREECATVRCRIGRHVCFGICIVLHGWSTLVPYNQPPVLDEK